MPFHALPRDRMRERQPLRVQRLAWESGQRRRARASLAAIHGIAHQRMMEAATAALPARGKSASGPTHITSMDGLVGFLRSIVPKFNCERVLFSTGRKRILKVGRVNEGVEVAL